MILYTTPHFEHLFSCIYYYHLYYCAYRDLPSSNTKACECHASIVEHACTVTMYNNIITHVVIFNLAVNYICVIIIITQINAIIIKRLSSMPTYIVQICI